MRNTSIPSCVGVGIAPIIGTDELQHPTLHPRPLTGAGWVFENKFDGFRALVRKRDGEPELISRNGRSMARAFPEVIQVTCAADPS